MISSPEDRFRPRDGAVLDLASLGALADATDHLLGAFLSVAAPGHPALVLDGLDIDGPLSPQGPPGTRALDLDSDGVTVSAGRAVLSAADGRRYLVEVPRPVRAAWPTPARARGGGTLVGQLRVQPGATPGGLAVARESVRFDIGFLRPGVVPAAHHVPLAVAIGNGRDWATDLARVWQPEHEAVQAVAVRLDEVDRLIWRAEPEGAVWNRQVLGRNWVRYQTVASSALQAARLALKTRPSSTLDRVRLFEALHLQLRDSVERAATELLQLFSPIEAAGPYRRVLDGEPGR
jgi:hypothetical protein